MLSKISLVLTILLFVILLIFSQSVDAEQCTFYCGMLPDDWTTFSNECWDSGGLPRGSPWCDCYYHTPIVIDTDGSGFHLTSAAAGVYFDFPGYGNKRLVSWTAAESTNAFLVWTEITTARSMMDRSCSAISLRSPRHR